MHQSGDGPLVERNAASGVQHGVGASGGAAVAWAWARAAVNDKARGLAPPGLCVSVSTGRETGATGRRYGWFPTRVELMLADRMASTVLVRRNVWVR